MLSYWETGGERGRREIRDKERGGRERRLGGERDKEERGGYGMRRWNEVQRERREERGGMKG